MERKLRVSRKLLVASIGVATMTYLGTNCGSSSSDNVTPATGDGAVGGSSSGTGTGSGSGGSSGSNPTPGDARADRGGDGPIIGPVGNLMPLPTSDATMDSSKDSPADVTTADSPQDSTTQDSGTDAPLEFDVIIGNLIIQPMDSGGD